MITYVEIENSSLVTEVFWDSETRDLTVVFKGYFVEYLVYENVPSMYIEAFSKTQSAGKFYLQLIKPKFKLKKQKMTTKTKTASKDAEAKPRPETTNKSSDSKRYIEMSIDLDEVIKDWIFIGEKEKKNGRKGKYLHITLALLPDGQLDGYGNLGMVTQKVPKEVYIENKETRGPILGNGSEFKRKSSEPEGQPGVETAKRGVDEDDIDLPF